MRWVDAQVRETQGAEKTIMEEGLRAAQPRRWRAAIRRSAAPRRHGQHFKRQAFDREQGHGVGGADLHRCAPRQRGHGPFLPTPHVHE
jgi:hypothetical protein